jgi:hypothetical protein
VNEQNLIPFNKMSPEKHKAIAARGGRNKGVNHAISSKITWMKKRGDLGDVDSRHMYELMTNPDVSSLDIQKHIKRLEEIAHESGSPSAIEKVAKLAIDWHKMHHGDKKKIDVRSVSYNFNEPMSNDEMKQIMGEDFE